MVESIKTLTVLQRFSKNHKNSLNIFKMPHNSLKVEEARKSLSGKLYFY